MDKFYARPVFFVRDAPSARDFYTQTLGFKLDWTHEEQGLPYVFQVSFFGTELILNQTEDGTEDCPGHGRIFIGLNEEQAAAFVQHVQSRGLSVTATQWGGPTLILFDQDRNEFFFWMPDAERSKLIPDPPNVRSPA